MNPGEATRVNWAPTPSGCASGLRRPLLGVDPVAGGGAHFRVWAPASPTAAIEGGAPEEPESFSRVMLEAEGEGYFSGFVPWARPGSRYKIRLQDGAFPDPASRFQPDGPHGASEIIDETFAWTDASWRGRPAREWVMYELHLGTFTREGTWAAAQAQLPELARLGVTVIEVMPVAEFPGAFGWGYDGVALFAPSRLYGRPEDARAFVNRAHELGLMVILDVVYNHLGPDGNYLKQFSPDYFNAGRSTEWGEPPNFDGKNAGPVREFFVGNACHWIEAFHFDGLRFDAAQQIFDDSATHILAEIVQAARAVAPGRELCFVAENERQEARLARATGAGGYGLDALWNDDFHHSAMVAASGRADAYYSGYRGSPQEMISCAKYGFLYQGQWYGWQRGRRGTPALDLEPLNFVTFLQNHDQVANSLHGLRLHQLTSPGRCRALTALLLLSPQVPLLFQGQEFGASSPFLYFADHNPEIAALVRRGRAEFLRQFPAIASEESSRLLCDPGAPDTFERCRLDFDERRRNNRLYQLHHDLLRLRREDPMVQQCARLDGAVLGAEALALRYFLPEQGDRLLVVNLGVELLYNPVAEPLLAPVAGQGWQVGWSSEAPEYGGAGTPPVETASGWSLPGHAAVLLKPHENRDLLPAKLSQAD